jgi:hemerythrin-like metal-binding protein
MEFIKWNDKMSVNIISIDTQHKKLIEEINNFYNNLTRKSNKEVISDILFQLKKYSIYHFQTEEALLKKYGFQGYKLHKEEHDRFIKKVDEIEKKLSEGKMVLSVEIANFLKDWLTNHVFDTDKQYSEYLVSNGVK